MRHDFTAPKRRAFADTHVKNVDVFRDKCRSVKQEFITMKWYCICLQNEPITLKQTINKTRERCIKEQKQVMTRNLRLDFQNINSEEKIKLVFPRVAYCTMYVLHVYSYMYMCIVHEHGNVRGISSCVNWAENSWTERETREKYAGIPARTRTWFSWFPRITPAEFPRDSGSFCAEKLWFSRVTRVNSKRHGVCTVYKWDSGESHFDFY